MQRGGASRRGKKKPGDKQGHINALLFVPCPLNKSKAVVSPMVVSIAAP